METTREYSPAEMATLNLSAKSAQLERTRAEFAQWRRANIITCDGHRAWKTSDSTSVPSLRQMELSWESKLAEDFRAHQQALQDWKRHHPATTIAPRS